VPDERNSSAPRVCIARVVRLQRCPRDDLVNKCLQLIFRELQSLTPIAGEREHRRRLVGLRRQVVTQLLDQLFVHNLVELIGTDQGGRAHLIAKIVRVQRDHARNLCLAPSILTPVAIDNYRANRSP
jgi:hypothetical protein